MLEQFRPPPENQVSQPDLVPAAAQDDAGFDARRVLGVVRRHKWLIIGTMAAIIGLAGLVTSQLQRQYTATALVTVDARDAKVLGFEPGVIEGLGGNSLIDTEVVIAGSSAVLSRVAQELDLVNWPEFAARRSFLEMLQAMVGLGGDTVAGEPGEASYLQLSDTKRAGLVKDLSEHLDIGRTGMTSVISISATMRTPEGAALIANTIAEAYLQEQIEAKLSSTERAAAFLRTRVTQLAGDIADLETELDTFLSEKLVEVGSPETRALLERLNDVTRNRESSAVSLAGLQSAISAADYARIASLLRDQDTDLVRQRQLLLDELQSDDAARVAAARDRLSSLDEDLRTAAERRASLIQGEMSAADARAAGLRRDFEAALARQELPKEFSVELFRLQRDLETRRSLYDSILTKLGQIEQQSDFNLPDSRVIAGASPPDQASFPPLMLIAAGSLIFSLFAGIGLAFLRENLIGGVTSIEQLEYLTGVPVIAGVPRFSPTGNEQPDMAIITQPLSAFSEAIRRIRLGVEDLAPKDRIVMLTTSPLPGDGKTTISLALARQMAITGRKTLLIDADMRHPSIRKALNETPERGLIDFLAGPSVAEEDLPIIKEVESGLDLVLGAHASVVATDALLMTERFGDLMKYATANYEVVIVDTPPVGLVVDARIVARYCDLALFVVRHAATSQHVIQQSLRDLTVRNELQTCAVLNQIERASGYQYGYGHAYDAYYR